MRWFAFLPLLMGLGCSPSNPKAEDFIPPEEQARKSLDLALQAWKDGKTASLIEGTEPPVEVVDARSEGRTLLDYEILGLVPGEASRCFAVRMSLGNPAKNMTERYVVLGLNPIWIWRYDDFVMLSHWDHRMTKNSK